MDLRHLTVFVAVAEEEGFSRAADRLRVAQSAVSATVRNLEREWGVVLFHRTTHRVALSAEGRALLPEARAALAAAARVGDAVGEVRGGLRGTLRLGIVQAGAMPRGVSAAAVLAAFREEHPGVTFDLRQGGSELQAEAVRSGELDLAFVGLPDVELPGLTTTVLARDTMVLACHRDHRLAGRSAVELDELGDEPFVELPSTWGVRIANDRAFAAAGVTRTVAHEINDLGTAVDFVRHGLALAVVPPLFVADPAIVTVPIGRHAPGFVVSLVLPAGRPPGAAARAFAATAARVTRPGATRSSSRRRPRRSRP
ncbi:LysR family transcriptional regulator [Patulibacter sp.]|uniref:LysR family transcriptional regulator n=1 Tax=Patulibacter sp. TaxID=1912859 RepID=UPI00271F9D72|nr:LysR family transcriptional regulator [Patulibacter sp.]MDO9407449.1 LysR family transcriptional regulator [Patulibacter sp.]